MDITLTILQSKVMAAVAQKTSYSGGKLQENPKEQDPAALDRIATVDEDEDELKTFWDECRAEVVNAVSDKLVSEGFDATNTDSYHLTMNLWDEFNIALVPAMEINLFNYFVYGIIARWYLYTHKEEASTYASLADNCLDKLKSETTNRAFTRKMYPF